MSQHDMIISDQAGAAFLADLNLALAALISNNSGATEPATTYAYMPWADIANDLLKIRNAANNGWVSLGTLSAANLGHALLAANIFTGLQTWKTGANIASAATIDLTAATGNLVHITGTTTTTAVTMTSGQWMRCVADGALPLTYHATNLRLNGAASYTCVAGDTIDFFYDGTTVFANITKKDGTAVVGQIGPVLGTKTATTSGYQIDWTGIPSTAKEVTISLAGVSTDGTSAWRIQIGDGAIDATSYTGAGLRLTNATAAAVTNFTDGFGINTDGSATVMHGSITIRHIGDNVWVASGTLARSDSATVFVVGGSKTLAGMLDRIRLTNPTTDGFDLGSANISYQ